MLEVASPAVGDAVGLRARGRPRARSAGEMVSPEASRSARCKRLRNSRTLPDQSWWDNYYTLLKDKLPALRSKYESDSQALELIQQSNRNYPQ